MRSTPLLCLFTLAIAVLPWAVSAECTVQFEPAKVISEYLSNTERVMTKIREVTASSRCGLEGTGVVAGIFSQPAQEGMRLGSEVVQASNEVADFSSFLSTWEFYVIMPITQSDAPSYLYRDNELLERQHEKIQQLGKTLARKCALNAKIAAQSVEIKGKTGNAAQYPATEKTVSDVLGDLIKNNGDVLTYYRNIAIGWKALESQKRLENSQESPFFPNQGTEMMSKAYDGSSPECQTGNQTFQQLIEAGGRIVYFWRNTGTATKYWIEAWKLMSGLGGGGGKDYEKAEKELLKKELARQGIGGRAADKMLANLDRANDASHQGLTGFLRAMGSNFMDTFTDFGSQLAQTYKQFQDEKNKFTARQNGGGASAIGTDTLSQAVQGKDDADQLAMDVISNYLSADALAANGDAQAAATIQILVDTHRRLQFTYEIIVDAQKDAEKVCNSQGANVKEARDACNASKVNQRTN